MPSPKTSRRRRALLAQAKRVIGQRYPEFDLSLDEVAEAVGSSRRQLQRVFAELEGQDFRAYLLSVRMERAMTLISRQSHPIPVRAAAPQVGYRHASGVRQAFKRYFGFTPAAIQPAPPHYLGDQLIDRSSLSMERSEH